MTGRRITFSLGICALGVLAAVPAYGWFTAAPGSASGAGQVGSMQVVTLVALTDETVGSALLPGSSGELVLKLANPNAYPVRITKVNAAGPVSVTGAEGCTAGNSNVALVPQTGLSIRVAANEPGLVVRLSGAAAMGPEADNACQGATFAIPVAVTVETP